MSDATAGVESVASDPTLRPFDVVVVPRLDRVYIVGQVNTRRNIYAG